MKYLILRKRPGGPDNPFMRMVAAGGSGAEFQFPCQLQSQELQHREASDLRLDPNVDAVVPSMPFALIAPVAGATAEATAWGLEAIGVGFSKQDGDGVTVAVLDTGIDKPHPAFAGIPFADDDLVDFIADETGKPGATTTTVTGRTSPGPSAAGTSAAAASGSLAGSRRS